MAEGWSSTTPFIFQVLHSKLTPGMFDAFMGPLQGNFLLGCTLVIWQSMTRRLPASTYDESTF